MVGWLQDAFLELTQKIPLDFEELRPAKPYSNRDPPDRNREATSLNWETLAWISNLQMKVVTSINSFAGNRYRCTECAMNYGGSHPTGCLCKCRLLAMVDEAFREELKSYPGHVEHPLLRKLPISFLYLLKTVSYSQQHQQRITSKKKTWLVTVKLLFEDGDCRKFVALLRTPEIPTIWLPLLRVRTQIPRSLIASSTWLQVPRLPHRSSLWFTCMESSLHVSTNQ